VSYLIPTEELSLAKQEVLRQGAIMAGKNLAAAHNIAALGTLTARDADYVTDFVPVATSAGIAGWLSMPFVAVGALYSVFADNVPAAFTYTVLNNQVVVFYKVNILTIAGPDPASMLFFRTGAAANTKAVFDLESLQTKTMNDGYFSKPVVYEPQEIATIQAEARVAIAVGCRIRLGCFIIEPLQVTTV